MSFLTSAWRSACVLAGILVLSLSAHEASAQTPDSLLATLDTGPETTQLLPEHMVFTQRIFWGQKGLLRLSGLAPLTDAGREKEMHLRRSMLVTHQVLGYVTLAGMIAQGIVGARLYNGHRSELGLHENIAAGVNVAYFTTAGLSLLAPPPLLSRRVKGLNSMKLHRGLAVVHFSAMVATNLLAGKAHDPNWKPYHRAAAYTAFGSFATAMIVMKF